MKPPLQTEKDLTLVKEYILLPIILDVLERDVKVLETAQLKMSVIYVKTLRCIQDKVIADLVLLRKRLRECGIKIYEQHRTQSGIEAEYLCRGYHHTFSMLWGLVKAELEKRLSVYLDIDLTDDDGASS